MKEEGLGARVISLPTSISLMLSIPQKLRKPLYFELLFLL
jgi:hypothetical protein